MKKWLFVVAFLSMFVAGYSYVNSPTYSPTVKATRTFTATGTITATITSTFTITPTNTPIETVMIWYASTNHTGLNNPPYIITLGWSKYTDSGSQTYYTLLIDDNSNSRTMQYDLTNADSVDKKSNNRFLYEIPGSLYNGIYTAHLTVSNANTIKTPMIAKTIVIPTATP